MKKVVIIFLSVLMILTSMASLSVLAAGVYPLGTDILKNGDFESEDSGFSATGKKRALSDWGAYPDNVNNDGSALSGPFMTAISKSADSTAKDYVRSGDHSILFENKPDMIDKVVSPYMMQNVREGVYPGAVYRASFWVKFPAENNEDFNLRDGRINTGYMSLYINGNLVGAKVRYATAPAGYDAHEVDANGWYEVIYDYVVPDNTTSVSFWIRLTSTGTAYVDDASLTMIKAPTIIDVNTDWVFYYSDKSVGLADARVSSFYPEYKNGYIEFSISDGQKTLSPITKATLNSDLKAQYTMDLDYLKELNKQYYLVAEFKNSDGSLIERIERNIYRVSRPKMMSKNNEIFFDTDGDGDYTDEKQFFPVVGFHVHPSDYAKAKEMGITVVQCSSVSQLDSLDKFGLKGLITLYLTNDKTDEMYAAGREGLVTTRNSSGQYVEISMVEHTLNTIEEAKDHPALFGYAVVDEPNLNSIPEGDLERSYKLIRENDDIHPIYICESEKEYFSYTMKYVDILCNDPYTSTATEAYRQIKNADNKVNGEKIICSLLMTYQNSSGYYPTGNAERHMIYQSLFAGAQMIGFFTISDSYNYYGKDSEPRPIFDTGLEGDTLWDTLCEFSKEELEIVFKHFGFGNYVTNADNTINGMNYLPAVRSGSGVALTYGYSDTVRWNSWVDEQRGSLFVAVANQSTTEDLKTTVDVGGITSKTKLKKIFGTDRTPTFENGKMTVDIEKYNTVLYELDLKTIDLDLRYFNDLEDSSWAKDAIVTLYQKGVVNSKGAGIFNPSQNITRGELAMFLIRALDLSVYGAENFSDVAENAEYKKEIATGKALGILKGTDGINYNPTAEITRQDLMTICARGIEQIGKLKASNAENLNAFPDSALVADYAKDSVASMVKSGIVAGNADGTLNPLGNATRAEAAVIMNRIMNMK